VDAGTTVVGVGGQNHVPGGFDVVGEAAVAVFEVRVECRDFGIAVGIAEEPVGDVP
jgi:hypothetical protein